MANNQLLGNLLDQSGGVEAKAIPSDPWSIIKNALIYGLADIPDIAYQAIQGPWNPMMPHTPFRPTPVADYMTDAGILKQEVIPSPEDKPSHYLHVGARITPSLLLPVPGGYMAKGGGKVADSAAPIAHPTLPRQLLPLDEFVATRKDQLLQEAEREIAQRKAQILESGGHRRLTAVPKLEEMPDPLAMPKADAPISRTGLPEPTEISDRERLGRALEAVEEQARRLREPRSRADIELDRLGAEMMEAYYKAQNRSLSIDERARWAEEFAKRKDNYVTASKPKVGQTVDLQQQANGVYRQPEDELDRLDRLAAEMMEAQQKSMDKSLSAAERDRWTAEFIRLREEYVDGSKPPSNTDGAD